MTPESLFAQLASKLGVAALKPDARGRVRLDFADLPAIELAVPARGQLYAEAELDRLGHTGADGQRAIGLRGDARDAQSVPGRRTPRLLHERRRGRDARPEVELPGNHGADRDPVAQPRVVVAGAWPIVHV